MNKGISTIIGVLLIALAAGVAGTSILFFSQEVQNNSTYNIREITINHNEDMVEVTEEEKNEEIEEEVQKDTFSVKIKIKGEGNIFPKEGKYDYEKGKDLLLKAEARDGWFFQGWSQPQESIPGIPQMSKTVHYSLFGDDIFDYNKTGENEAKIKIDRNYEIWANFEKEKHQLVVKTAGQGDVYPRSGSYYNYGTKVTVKPIPAEGWVFKNWERCGIYLPGGFLCDNLYDKEASIWVGREPYEFRLTAIFEEEKKTKENIIEVVVQDLSKNKIEGVDLVDPGPGLYQYSPGKMFTVKINHSTDYNFQSWRLCSYSPSGDYSCAFSGSEKEISFSKKGGRVLLIAEFMENYEFRVIE